MDNIKRKLLIAILIVLVLIIVVIICLMNINENGEDYGNNIIDNVNNIVSSQPEEDEDVPQDTVVDYTTISKFNSYYMFDLEDKINLLFDFVQSKKSNELYSLFSNEYKNSNGITANDILEKVNLPYSEFIIQEVYSSENEYNGKFYIYGLAKREDANTTLEDMYFIIDVYYANSAFEITLSNEDEFKNAQQGIGEKVENKVIEQNGYNRIEASTMTTEQVIKKYINDYKNKALFKPEYAYKLLSNENKSEYFTSLQDYIKYIQENKEIIENMSIITYNKEIKDEYIEYNILCDDNSRYIIKSEELMNYAISIQ